MTFRLSLLDRFDLDVRNNEFYLRHASMIEAHWKVANEEWHVIDIATIGEVLSSRKEICQDAGRYLSYRAEYSVWGKNSFEVNFDVVLNQNSTIALC